MSHPSPGSRILVTGFEPFDGDSVNPSLDLARELDGARFGAARVHAASLPVDRVGVVDVLEGLLQRHGPALVVCLGQGTGRRVVDLETLAWNAIDFGERTDNAGHEAHGEPLIPDGPPTLGSTLPLDRLAAVLRRGRHPVQTSRDAGRHLCNAVYYHLLARRRGPFAVFVHVPLLPEQALRRGRGEASMDPTSTRPCLGSLLAALSLLPLGTPS